MEKHEEGPYEDMLAHLFDFGAGSMLTNVPSPDSQGAGASTATGSPLSGASEVYDSDWGDPLDVLQLSDLLAPHHNAKLEPCTPSQSPPPAPSMQPNMHFMPQHPPAPFGMDPSAAAMGHPASMANLHAARLAQAQAQYMAHAQMAAARMPQPLPPGAFLPTPDQANAAIFAAAAAAASIPFVQPPGSHYGPMPPGPVGYGVKQPDKVPIQRLSVGGDRGGPVGSTAEKKTSHNKIERRYRDKLNGQLVALRDAVPATAHMAKANKATVMRKAADHIAYLTAQNDRLRRHNDQLLALATAHGLGKRAHELLPDLADDQPDDRPKAKKQRAGRPAAKATKALGLGLAVASFVYNPFALLLPQADLASQSMGTQRVLSGLGVAAGSDVAGLLWWGLRLLLLLLLSLRLLGPASQQRPSAQQCETAASHSKQAARAQASGQLAQARRQLVCGLLALGHSVPAPRLLELALATAGQAVRQLGHRLVLGLWLEASAGPAEELAARLQHMLVGVGLAAALADQGVGGLLLLHDTLAAVNSAEAAGGSPQLLADVYATACAVLVAVDAPPLLLRVYAHLAGNARKACAAAGAQLDPEKEWAYHGDGMAYLLAGRWLAAYRRAAQAGRPEASNPVALIGHLGRADGLLGAYGALCEGAQSATQLADSLADLRHMAEQAGATDTVGWCDLGTAVCTLRLNDLARTRALLRALRMGPASQREALALVCGLEAAVGMHEGKVEAAQQALARGSEALGQAAAVLVLQRYRGPTLRATVQCLAADLLLGTRLQLGEGHEGQALEGAAARDMLALSRVAEALPMATTVLQRYQGRLRVLAGASVLRSQHLLHKAAKSARRHGQLRDEALALLCMAMVPGPCALAAEQQQWLGRAQELLQATHSYGDLRACRMAMQALRPAKA